MKKTIVLLFTILFILNIIADDRQKTNLKVKEMPSLSKMKNTVTREAPAVEFEVDPVDIIHSYYDYMPGSYCSNPLQLQPEISMPYGYQAGGLYAAFHVTENPSSATQRRVFYAYINSSGELVSRTTITDNDTREGHAGIDVDYVTGNPIAAWHNIVEADDSYDCSMSYDLFHLMSGPGLWKEAFIVIDNPEDSSEHTEHDNDEFIWPRVKIGPSPIDGKRRVHIMGNNYTDNSEGHENYNILAGYADFDALDMENQIELEFTYFSFPEWDELHYDDIARIIKELVVADDGQVAFIGYYGTTWCIQYSEDYGETWTYYETSARYDLENPLNQDGSYYFLNEDDSPATIFSYPSSDGGHFNAFFTENNSKIIAMGAFGINSEEGFANGTYMPSMFYPKIYNYSIVNGELNVHVIDLYIEGADPNDGIPMIPWDLNEDVYVDEYDEEGYVGMVTSIPSWSWSGMAQDAFFHESNFKLSIKENWVIAVWQDAEGVYFNYNDEPGYEDWAEKPEVAIAVSGDYGTTWSQPAFLNANTNDENYYEELAGMIPVYVYPADQLEIIDNTHAKLHLFFMDDYSYSNFNYNEGGMLTYAALNVEMPEPVNSSPENTIVSTSNVILHQNYPNPFNPETTISFLTTKDSKNTKIDIYNIKGQKIKELEIRNVKLGINEVVWDGTDSQNIAVSSGVYFYKLNTDLNSTVKRMILMK